LEQGFAFYFSVFAGGGSGLGVGACGTPSVGLGGWRLTIPFVDILSLSSDIPLAPNIPIGKQQKPGRAGPESETGNGIEPLNAYVPLSNSPVLRIIRVTLVNLLQVEMCRAKASVFRCDNKK
jgi:hypothetical protein